jgi:hypothetical protein
MNRALRTYLTLGFRLNENFLGMVDSYFGPPEIRDRVSNRPWSLQRLLDAYLVLRESLKASSLDPIILEFLIDQTDALTIFLKQKISSELPFHQYASRILQVELLQVPNVEIASMKKILEGLLWELGYHQSFREALVRLEDSETLTGDALLSYFESEIPRYRELSRMVFQIPEGERVTIETYSGPIPAYILYKGNLHTVVQLNPGTRTKRSLKALIPHETYPGHHLHYASREVAMAGHPLTNHFLYSTPEATVVEGLGTWAPSLIASQTLDLREEALVLVDRWNTAIRNNAMLLFWDQGKSRHEVGDYLQDVGYFSEQQVERFFTFITAQFFDVYSFSYSYGKALVESLHKNAKENGREREFLDFLYKNHTTPNMLRRRFLPS